MKMNLENAISVAPDQRGRLNHLNQNLHACEAGELQSCVYKGVVTHQRWRQFEHRFSYRIFLFYLDLGELETLFNNNWMCGYEKTRIASFWRKDHLGETGQTLSDAVRKLIYEQTGSEVSGPIRVLTHLRYYGIQMNPVSFYYCFHTDGKTVDKIVAEVNNTPWNEQHCYVLDWPDSNSEHAELSNQKNFHVSPFLPMNLHYHWLLSCPGEELKVRIQNYEVDQRVFEANLELRRQKLTNWTVLSNLLRFPCMTAQVFAGIYWQALKLWWRGATYYPHPQRG